MEAIPHARRRAVDDEREHVKMKTTESLVNPFDAVVPAVQMNTEDPLYIIGQLATALQEKTFGGGFDPPGKARIEVTPTSNADKDKSKFLLFARVYDYSQFHQKGRELIGSTLVLVFHITNGAEGYPATAHLNGEKPRIFPDRESLVEGISEMLKDRSLKANLQRMSILREIVQNQGK